MSQPSGDGQPSGGYEDPPPLETVDPSHVSMPPPHLAENMPLRRAAEADVSARFVTFKFLTQLAHFKSCVIFALAFLSIVNTTSMSLKQRFKMGNEKCFAFVFYEFHFLSLSLSS